jgi:hypothetical protein
MNNPTTMPDSMVAMLQSGYGLNYKQSNKLLKFLRSTDASLLREAILNQDQSEFTISSKFLKRSLGNEYSRIIRSIMHTDGKYFTSGFMADGSYVVGQCLKYRFDNSFLNDT